MYKYLSCIILVIALFTQNAKLVSAQEYDESASFKPDEQMADFDYRVENLRLFLEEYNSPLAEYSKDLVYSADQNGLDYRLVPAISGVESTFGKRIPFNSYNAYGWANGNYNFTSWSDSIDVVSETLKSSYIEKGAASLAKMGKRYAPPSNTWAGKVQYFVSKIDTLPLNFDII